MADSHPNNLDPRPKRRRDEENPFEIYTTGINTAHPLLPESRDGLTQPSPVLLEQIRTVDKRRLSSYIGRLDKKHIRGINHALAVSIGLIKPVPPKLTLCLCGACADAFRGTGAFALRTASTPWAKK